jgi:hypothetical protein
MCFMFDLPKKDCMTEIRFPGIRVFRLKGVLHPRLAETSVRRGGEIEYRLTAEGTEGLSKLT